MAEWVLVPREATEEMAGAFHEADEAFQNGCGLAPDSQWDAMLSASPSPAEDEELVGDVRLILHRLGLGSDLSRLDKAARALLAELGGRDG